MGKQFEVEWSDFSGGHFFGAKETKQPQNTWTGDDVIACAGDGFLMPGAPIVLSDSDNATSGDNSRPHGRKIVWSGQLGFYRGTQLTKNFRYAGVDYSTGGKTLRGTIAAFSGKLIMGCTTAFLAIFDPSGLSLSMASTTPVAFSNVYTWDAFALGTAGTNRLYFSAVYDPTSWNSNDYIDIGEAGAVIGAIVSTPQGLLVGTATGWWQVTGVLGQTTTIRQITTKGITSADAVEVDSGVIHGAGSNPPQAVARLLNGTQTPTILWDKTQTFDTVEMSKVGGQYVFILIRNAAGGVQPDQLYMWSEHGRMWRRVTTPSPYTTKTNARVASDPSARADTAYISVQGANANGPSTSTYTYEIDPFDPPVDSAGTAYQQATVDLASYDHRRPFRIDELIVELDLGSTSLNATRSLGVTIKAPSAIVDYHASLSALAANASQPQTFTLPSMATTAYERPVIRFSPNDAGPTMSFAPSLTMQGVKVRRVIARCTEES